MCALLVGPRITGDGAGRAVAGNDRDIDALVGATQVGDHLLHNGVRRRFIRVRDADVELLPRSIGALVHQFLGSLGAGLEDAAGDPVAHQDAERRDEHT